MSEESPQRVELAKSKRDAIMDGVSLVVFTGMVYFVLNPGSLDWLKGKIGKGVTRITHTMSVWQTQLSIRSLPETDDS